MSKNIDNAVRQQIRTMRDAGNSYTAIESALGIPLSDVIKIVKSETSRSTSPASDKIRSDFGKFHSREPNETLRCCAQTEECATPSKISPHHKKPAARSLRTARWTFKRIGAHLGISPSTAHAYASDIKIRRRQRSRVPKRNHRITEARQMRRNGDTLEKIAAHFGFTHQAVDYWTRDIPNPRRLTVKRSKPTELTKKREKAYLSLNRECRWLKSESSLVWIGQQSFDGWSGIVKRISQTKFFISTNATHTECLLRSNATRPSPMAASSSR